MIVQVAAAAMIDDHAIGTGYRFYLVPYGLNVLDQDQVAHWWVWDNYLNIRVAKAFVQELPERGCEVFHDKNCVIKVSAYKCDPEKIPDGSPDEVDIVQKTTDELGRIHQRVNVRGEAYLPVPHDFPYWHRVAGDVHGKLSFENLWKRNIGDVFSNFFGFSDAHL